MGNPNVNFLFEIGALKHIPRAWKQFIQDDVTNVSEHTFRVVWISLILAKMEGVGNTDKIMKMALIHDIPESRTGDPNYLTRQYITKDEEGAAEEILEGIAGGEEWLQIFDEYQKRETPEAKLVKDADILDVDFELKELGMRGNVAYKKFMDHRIEFVHDRLQTDSAKKLLKDILESDPYEWHLESPRNRFNGGDWQK
jgi:putative hydrolase of HD superfamily